MERLWRQVKVNIMPTFILLVIMAWAMNFLDNQIIH
jgi:hypothetical protein